MKRFWSLVYKDFLLLLRDKVGLLFLFVMPLILVLVMTGMQEGAFSEKANKSISLLIVDHDNDTIGATITRELKGESLFNVSLAKDIDPDMTEQELRNLVASGQYLLGIYIPDSTTQTIRNRAATSLDGVEQAMLPPQMRTDTDDKTDDDTASFSLSIYIDPTTERSFRQILTSYIQQAALEVENNITLTEIAKVLCKMTRQEEGTINLNSDQHLDLEEIIAGNESAGSGFNAATHNVPAWTLFAIFFIVISFSGNVIKEREDGSYARLMTTPCPYFTYLLSKLFVYLIVCLLQALLIISMGLWLFPVLGLPVFTLAGHFAEYLFVTVCAAFAAIGFGMVISAFATTHGQAATFGAISVVIFSAIGGIWVPTFLMPKFLQVLSRISPLNWGIDSFYDILLRGTGWQAFLPKCLLLIAFAAACFSIALLSKKKAIK